MKWSQFLLKQKLRNASSYLLNSLQSILTLQAAIGLITTPIAVIWGLRFSPLTIVGNIIHVPFVTLFITTSLLSIVAIFFGAPPHWCASLIDTIALLWEKVLTIPSNEVLYGHPLHTTTIAGTILISLAGLHILLTSSYSKRLATKLILCNLLMHVVLAFPGLTPSQQPLTLTRVKTRSLKALCSNKGLLITDHGYLGSIKPDSSTVSFELCSVLTRNFGTIPITALTLTRVNMQTLCATEQLIRNWPCKTIYLPWFAPLKPSGWKAFFHLLNYAKERNIKIVRGA